LIWFQRVTIGRCIPRRRPRPTTRGGLAYPNLCKQIGTSANWYSFFPALFGYDGAVMRYVGFHTAPLT